MEAARSRLLIISCSHNIFSRKKNLLSPSAVYQCFARLNCVRKRFHTVKLMRRKDVTNILAVLPQRPELSKRGHQNNGTVIVREETKNVNEIPSVCVYILSFVLLYIRSVSNLH